MAREFQVHSSHIYPGCPATIPWDLIEPHREQALYNHAQSLETLNSRGGLGPKELYAVLQDCGYEEAYLSEIEAVQFLLYTLDKEQAVLEGGNDQAQLAC